MYFGRIADRRNHRLVLTLCSLGYLLALLWVLMTCRLLKSFRHVSLKALGYLYEIFPISVVWISSLFLFIGGGPFVFAAVTAALVASLVEASRRYVIRSQRFNRRLPTWTELDTCFS